MARETFEVWRPRAAAAPLVQLAQEIGADYAAQGYPMTARQMYYQFVARDVIENTYRSYKNLCSILDKARMGGLLDWDYIEDRTRNVYGTDGHSESPERTIELAALAYRRAMWQGQPYHVEVWVEKEALAGVVERAASENGVNYFACRGYVSQSEMKKAGDRFNYYRRNKGARGLLLHLGDHDPSGIDMTRDIEDRLYTFTRGNPPAVRRIALNMDQIEQYEPPPNFAKESDSRHAKYLEEFGEDSWELDALEPSVLNDLITEHVQSVVDEDLMQEQRDRQERERESLTAISDRYGEVIDFLGV